MQLTVPDIDIGFFSRADLQFFLHSAELLICSRYIIHSTPLKHSFFINRYLHTFLTTSKKPIISGNHIKIHNNTVHHCPNSGIRVDKGDYVALEDNVVHRLVTRFRY